MNLIIFIVLGIFGVFLALWLPLQHKRTVLVTNSTMASQQARLRAKISKKKGLVVSTSTVILFLFCCVFLLLVATRSLYFIDTRVFVLDYFLNIQIYSLSDFFINSFVFETGFDYLSKTLRLIFGDAYRLYLAFFPIFNLTIIWLALKENKHRNLIIFLYIGFFGLHHNTNILRAGVATAFIIVAFVMLQKKPIKALFFIILATLFHTTALVMLSMLLFRKRKAIKKRAFYFILLTIFLILYVTRILRSVFIQFLISVFSQFSSILPRANHFVVYLSQFYDASLAPSMFIFFLMAYYMIFYIKDVKKHSQLLNVLMLGFFMKALIPGEPVFLRLFEFFFIPTILMLPQILAKRPKVERVTILLGIWVFRIFSIVQLVQTHYHFI